MTISQLHLKFQQHQKHVDDSVIDLKKELKSSVADLKTDWHSNILDFKYEVGSSVADLAKQVESLNAEWQKNRSFDELAKKLEAEAEDRRKTDKTLVEVSAGAKSTEASLTGWKWTYGVLFAALASFGVFNYTTKITSEDAKNIVKDQLAPLITRIETREQQEGDLLVRNYSRELKEHLRYMSAGSGLPSDRIKDLQEVRTILADFKVTPQGGRDLSALKVLVNVVIEMETTAPTDRNKVLDKSISDLKLLADGVQGPHKRLEALAHTMLALALIRKSDLASYDESCLQQAQLSTASAFQTGLGVNIKAIQEMLHADLLIHEQKLDQIAMEDAKRALEDFHTAAALDGTGAAQLRLNNNVAYSLVRALTWYLRGDLKEKERLWRLAEVNSWEAFVQTIEESIREAEKATILGSSRAQVWRTRGEWLCVKGKLISHLGSSVGTDWPELGSKTADDVFNESLVSLIRSINAGRFNKLRSMKSTEIMERLMSNSPELGFLPQKQREKLNAALQDWLTRTAP